MDAVFRRLKVNHLKARIEVCHLQSMSIAHEFEGAGSLAEKSAIARKWDIVLKDSHHMRLALDLLEREEAEERETSGRASQTC
jgi:hypothetical protein